ncbi:MAG: biotin transporter BioY [Lachnospiraceae bacterium]
MSTSISVRMKTQDMVYIALFAVVMAICSWISIPAMVPFTLQTFGVFLAVGTLGGKRGSLAVLIYLLLGIVGLPVFSGFSGGLGYLMGNTGGYIIGFLFSSLVMWAMEYIPGKRKWVLPLSMLLGLLVCYLFGTVWFVSVYTKNVGEIGVWTALTWCVFPYIIPDLLKILLALSICRRLASAIKLSNTSIYQG